MMAGTEADDPGSEYPTIGVMVGELWADLQKREAAAARNSGAIEARMAMFKTATEDYEAQIERQRAQMNVALMRIRFRGHQQIVDRMGEMRKERAAADDAFAKAQRQEYAELVARCAEIGHLFAWGDRMRCLSGRRCAACDRPESDGLFATEERLRDDLDKLKAKRTADEGASINVQAGYSPP